MANSWYGSDSTSWSERAERVVREAIRRIKLEAKNDPAFVPPADDASLIIAARHFVVPPVIAPPPPDDVSAILAASTFNRSTSNVAAAGATTSANDASSVIANQLFARNASGRAAGRLTFGTHFTGGPYDGASDAAIAIDAVATNTASKIVTRDVNGDFAARQITAAVPAGTLMGSTLNSSVVVSSLERLGIQAEDLLFANGYGIAFITGGAADMAGHATLVAGSVTVNTTSATSQSLISITVSSPGGTRGHLSYSINPGVGFTVTSTSATETSIVSWVITIIL